MRRFPLLAFLLLTACGTVWTPVLPPAPPPVDQPPPTEPSPPVTPPPEAPVPVAELVARLAVGSTVAEANEVFGRAPDNISPAFGPAPETRRWFVTEGGQTWAVHAVFRNAKLSAAGATKVEEVR